MASVFSHLSVLTVRQPAVWGGNGMNPGGLVRSHMLSSQSPPCPFLSAGGAEVPPVQGKVPKNTRRSSFSLLRTQVQSRGPSSYLKAGHSSCRKTNCFTFSLVLKLSAFHTALSAGGREELKMQYKKWGLPLPPSRGCCDFFLPFDLLALLSITYYS